LSSTGQAKVKFWSRRKIIVAGILGVLLVIALPAISVVTVVFLVQPVKVQGDAMSPTYNNGDRIFVQKSSFKINRGDIVVFRYPKNPQASFLKRVIGLPNDVIEIKSGKVFINNQPVDEPYVSPERARQHHNYGPETVPVDSYFVMGDNRDASNDSRVFGPVTRNLIYGKVISRYFEASSK